MFRYPSLVHGVKRRIVSAMDLESLDNHGSSDAMVMPGPLTALEPTAARAPAQHGASIAPPFRKVLPKIRKLRESTSWIVPAGVAHEARCASFCCTR